MFFFDTALMSRYFVNFSGKYQVKFEHFVNFSYITLGKTALPPPKLTELLRLWPSLLGITRWSTVNVLGLNYKTSK